MASSGCRTRYLICNCNCNCNRSRSLSTTGDGAAETSLRLIFAHANTSSSASIDFHGTAAPTASVRRRGALGVGANHLVIACGVHVHAVGMMTARHRDVAG